MFLLWLISFCFEIGRWQLGNQTLLAMVDVVPVQHTTSSIEDLDSMVTLDGSFFEGKDGSIVVKGVFLDGRESTHLGIVFFLSKKEVLLLLTYLVAKQLFKDITLRWLIVFERL